MNRGTAPTLGAKTSAGLLQRELMTCYPDNFMIYAGPFAMGCLPHLQGQHRAGLKLIGQVRRVLPTTGNNPYFADLLAALPGNELRFAREIQAHPENNELFEFAQRQKATPSDAAVSARVDVPK